MFVKNHLGLKLQTVLLKRFWSNRLPTGRAKFIPYPSVRDKYLSALSFVTLLAPVLLLATSLYGCSGGSGDGSNVSTTANAPRLRKLYEDGVLRVNLGTEPPGLDWHTSTDSHLLMWSPT
ncbi:MAG: hypothetical protein IPP97_02080 [Candidatus Obscuribacter sp.]|nr:hypothetical protein [Candidatus Obscuribacter sp.]